MLSCLDVRRYNDGRLLVIEARSFVSNSKSNILGAQSVAIDILSGPMPDSAILKDGKASTGVPFNTSRSNYSLSAVSALEIVRACMCIVCRFPVEAFLAGERIEKGACR